MIPSFLTLFRRSRYGGELGSFNVSANVAKKRRHKEQERYLAAALGFCIKHDQNFAREFVKTVFGWKLPVAAQITCLVEPYACADLLLYVGERSGAIELKLGPKKSILNKKQDPEGNYDCDYLRDLSGFGIHDYAILGAAPSNGRSKVTKWRKRSWSDVAPLVEGPLLNDFRRLMRELIDPTDLPKEWSSQQFPEGWEQLQELARELVLDRKVLKTDGKEHPSYRGYHISLPDEGRGSSACPLFTMIDAIGRGQGWTGRRAAWLGYEINDLKPEAAIGFYVRDPRAAAEKIRKVLKLNSADYSIDWEPGYVRITRPPAGRSFTKPDPNVPEDKKWMSEIFRKIMITPTQKWKVSPTRPT